MNKFIAAEAAECIGCHACEIACAVAHNQENWYFEVTVTFDRVSTL